MEEDYEEMIDNVNREQIWKPYAEEWLEKFKSEETPIEKRITDYLLNGWGVGQNNKNKIAIEFHFEVTPVDENNTEWENPRRNTGYVEMTYIDGEYQLDYIGETPQGYDKFLEEFEKWKKTHSETETVVTQGENLELNSVQEQEVNKMSTGIVASCTAVLLVIGALVIFRIIKSFK